MRYQMAITLGPQVGPAAFAAFLAALADSLPSARAGLTAAAALPWSPATNLDRSVTWSTDFDTDTWAQTGTPLLLALLAAAHQPMATAWQVVGVAAAHPSAGVRLFTEMPGGWRELYRLP